jgi:hypothetical protein
MKKKIPQNTQHRKQKQKTLQHKTKKDAQNN